MRAKKARSFLGFVDLDREFIPDFSELAGPLLALTKKGAPFDADGCGSFRPELSLRR